MADPFTKKKSLSSSFRILIPLYATYIIFVASVFLIFVPQLKKQFLDQKKETILELTDSVLSLLAKLDLEIKQGKVTPETAREQAISQIRNIRYGPEGKDYFWINDMHPSMIMHPYREDLEGSDLTNFKDIEGNYPFVAMVEMVMRNKGGYVNYHWQWKDMPGKVVPKISYVKGFSSWGWIIGTGIYVEDIHQEIKLIVQKFMWIFWGILVFIILLSVYIAKEVFRAEHKKLLAEKIRELEEVRLKKLLELSQMTENSINELTYFALEEAIKLNESEIGYLAFLNEEASQLTLHTWSTNQKMRQGRIDDRIMVFNLEGTGLWAEAVRSRKPLIINDYASFSLAHKKGYPEGHVHISRILNVPIFDSDKIVAIAGVGNKKEDYNESDVRQLQLMMDGMWKIIQRKNAEDELSRSEERYRLLAENATDVIWVVQIPGFRFSYVSPAMESILGYPPAEFIGVKIGSHMDKKSVEKITRAITEELSRDSEDGVDPSRYRTIELEMIRKDGSRVWTEVRARFLRNKDGIPDRMLGTTREISRRKALERKLVHANTDLQMAQRIASLGNWSFAPDVGVTEWSDEAYRIYERDPELGPIPLVEYEQVYSKKWWERFNSAVQNAVRKGRPFDIELKLVLARGKVKWVHIICEPEKMKNKEIYFLRGTIQDITDRKIMEVRIQQTRKMEALGTLAGGIAHDFNNILSSILGFAELAKLGTAGDQDTQNNLDQVLSAGLRARDLVKHILMFSRKADVQKDVLQIVPLIKESLKFLKSSISARIEIRTQFNHSDHAVLADPTQLHQIFMNIFSNAAYAMKERGGVLDVELKSIDIFEDDSIQSKELNPGKYVSVTISDTGCGIPKNLIDKIFEPFFTTKTRGEGTGMGLSLAYGIIKEMKGHLAVYSEQNRGATFQILLPEQTGAVSKDRNLKQNIMMPGKGKILLIDDEANIIDWMSQVLLKLGYSVETAANGLEALKIFKQDPVGFDLVLTDLAMPKMTGIEVSKLIQIDRPGIPIILCTGFSEGLTPEMIKRYGISEMLMKPLIASELARVIGEYTK